MLDQLHKSCIDMATKVIKCRFFPQASKKALASLIREDCILS